MESSTGKERKFEGPVRGIAVNVREVAEMANFRLTNYHPLPGGPLVRGAWSF